MLLDEIELKKLEVPCVLGLQLIDQIMRYELCEVGYEMWDITYEEYGMRCEKYEMIYGI